MEVFNQDNLTSFIDETHINRSENNDIGIRCMRKKYKCIILWLLSIIVVTQFLIIVFDKMDEKIFNRLISKLAESFHSSNNTRTEENMRAPLP